MRVFFLSKQPCALKIDGAFLGYIDGVERFVELYPRDRRFCEIIPTNDDFAPLVFSLDEPFLNDPIQGVALYHFDSGIALFFNSFQTKNPLLKVLDSQSTIAGELTLFLQGVPQILMEKDTLVKTVTLDERFINGKIHAYENAVLIEGTGAVYLLDQLQNEVYYDSALSYHYDFSKQTLHVLTPLVGVLGRTVECIFGEANGNITLLQSTLSPCQTIDERLILCAFLQEFLYGEGEEFLCEDLRNSKKRLREFLGDYVLGIPLPNVAFGAGMVCPKFKNSSKKIYQLQYLFAEVEGGKIVNIKRQA